MGVDSYFLVFFADKSITLQRAFAACLRLHPSMKRGGDGFSIKIPNAKSTIGCGLNDKSWVIAEAREASERYGKPALAACDRRFEVVIENLDDAFQDYNTMFAVQEYLADLTKGWVILAWNGALLLEPEPTPKAKPRKKAKVRARKRKVRRRRPAASRE